MKTQDSNFANWSWVQVLIPVWIMCGIAACNCLSGILVCLCPPEKDAKDEGGGLAVYK